MCCGVCEGGDDKQGTLSGSIKARDHEFLVHSAASIISFSRSAATEILVAGHAEIIGLEMTLPRGHWACMSEQTLAESWRCTLSETSSVLTNSDLSWLLIGVELIGVADEEVFAAAKVPR